LARRGYFGTKIGNLLEEEVIFHPYYFLGSPQTVFCWSLGDALTKIILKTLMSGVRPGHIRKGATPAVVG
jgi:hypothetical protein